MNTQIKCDDKNCKNTATHSAECLWGKGGYIFTCENHAPEWLKGIKLGEMSPPAQIFGIKKSWYQRVPLN